MFHVKSIFVNTSDPGGLLFCCLSAMCVRIIENRQNAQRLPFSRRGSKELKIIEIIIIIIIIENCQNAQRLPSSRRGSKELMNAPSW